MTESIIIREAGAEAVGDAMIVMNEAFDHNYREAWTAGQCSSMLSLPGVWLSIAYIEDQPAGFALNRAIAGEAELLLLAVTSSCRRKGIASLLIARSKDLSREHDANNIHLEVRHNNPAFDLYVKCGFRIAGRRPAYYQDVNGVHHDAVTLSCSTDQL